MFLGSLRQNVPLADSGEHEGPGWYGRYRTGGQICLNPSSKIQWKSSRTSETSFSAFWTASKTQKLWVGCEHIDLWPAVVVFDVPVQHHPIIGVTSPITIS